MAKRKKKAAVRKRQNYDRKHLILGITVFLFFILFVFVVKVAHVGDANSITGNAVLESGVLGSQTVFALMVVMALYALAVVAYINQHHKLHRHKRGKRS